MHIPQGVKYIAGSAFYDSDLENITMEGGETIGAYAFSESKLRNIHIPACTKLIGEGAFYECDSLTEVIIDGGTLRGDAFRFCRALMRVTMADGVTLVGERIFHYDENLVEVNLPNDIETIPTATFSRCSKLKTISLPGSVNEIGGSAFRYCTGLTEMTVKAIVPPAIVATTFEEVDKSIPVYVPKESLEDYRTAEYWEEFTNFLPIDESSGVATVMLADGITVESGVVHIANIKSYGTVHVYDLTGRQVLRTSDSSFVLPRGIYIIKAGRETEKVIVR